MYKSVFNALVSAYLRADWRVLRDDDEEEEEEDDEDEEEAATRLCDARVYSSTREMI